MASLHACFEPFQRQVQYTYATDDSGLITLSLVKRRICWWRKTPTKCMTRSLNLTPKTVLRSGKSKAYVTIIRLRTSYYFVEANYWRTQSIARPLCSSRAICYNARYWYSNFVHSSVTRRYSMETA